jgi:tRNA pseudouridine38-40 synthase
MRPINPAFYLVSPQCSAQVYVYEIDTAPIHDPLTVRYRMHCPRDLDLASMRAAAALLVGRHDFTQFSNDTAERLRRNPVKDLRRLDVLECAGGALRLEVEGSGFLYKQARLGLWAAPGVGAVHGGEGRGAGWGPTTA